MNQTFTYFLICFFRFSNKINYYYNVISNIMLCGFNISCIYCKNIYNKVCGNKTKECNETEKDNDTQVENNNNSYGTLKNNKENLKNRLSIKNNKVSNDEINPIHLEIVKTEPKTIETIKKDIEINTKKKIINNLEDIFSDDESDNDSTESDDEKTRQKSYSESIILKNKTNLEQNLQIISELKEGDKLWLDNDKLSIDNSYYGQSMIRKYYGQNREDIIKFIKNTLEQAENENEYDLVTKLEKAKKGLRSLKHVYSESDVESISKYINENDDNNKEQI